MRRLMLRKNLLVSDNSLLFVCFFVLSSSLVSMRMEVFSFSCYVFIILFQKVHRIIDHLETLTRANS